MKRAVSNITNGLAYLAIITGALGTSTLVLALFTAEPAVAITLLALVSFVGLLWLLGKWAPYGRVV